jgi:protein-tyrosine phosphatase
MGAVHGVYLKYVGLSALSYAGYVCFADSDVASNGSDATAFSQGVRSLMMATSSNGTSASLARNGIAWILAYSAILNGTIAILFKLRQGMGMVGKSKVTGQIPFWSYILYFPFHLPTILYTFIHHKVGSTKKNKVPAATEVQPGWWVGGIYSNELNMDWAGIIDLTVEFPEACFDRSQSYLLCPTWDGVPANPDKLEEAANFAVEARKKGHVLIHCAHGRGRSTTVMCAALVRAGLFPTWQEAFEKGIKPARPVCKLNTMMKKALAEWQETYVDGKKRE